MAPSAASALVDALERGGLTPSGAAAALRPDGTKLALTLTPEVLALAVQVRPRCIALWCPPTALTVYHPDPRPQEVAHAGAGAAPPSLGVPPCWVGGAAATASCSATPRPLHHCADPVAPAVASPTHPPTQAMAASGFSSSQIVKVVGPDGVAVSPLDPGVAGGAGAGAGVGVALVGPLMWVGRPQCYAPSSPSTPPSRLPTPAHRSRKVVVMRNR